MSYKNFMNQVEKFLNVMTLEDTKALLQEMARKTEEEGRKQFLSFFDKSLVINCQEGIKKAHEYLERLESGEVYLTAYSYESYGDSYWDRDDTTEYEDPFNVCSHLMQIISLSYKFAYCDDYETGLQVMERLLSIELPVIEQNSGCDWTMDFFSMIEEGLLDIIGSQFQSNILYLIYQVYEGEMCYKKMTKLYELSLFQGVKIESILSLGLKPIQGFEKFVDGYLNYLKDVSGKRVLDIILELLVYYTGDSIDYAASVAETHPKVLQHFVSDAKGENKLSLGERALKIMKVTSTARGYLALELAENYKELNQFEDSKRCLTEAFISYSKPIVFLRMFVECDYQSVTARYHAYIKREITQKSSYMTSDNDEENIKLLYDELVIRTLYGDLDNVLMACQDDGYLGWTTAFKSNFIFLVLALLDIEKKETNMRKKVENKIRYLSLESDLISKWQRKQDLKPYRNLLPWIFSEMEKRVEAVVGGGYRHSYYKAAELIVYYCQVKSQYDGTFDRDACIDYFIKLNPRKRAFKSELNALLADE